MWTKFGVHVETLEGADSHTLRLECRTVLRRRTFRCFVLRRRPPLPGVRAEGEGEEAVEGEGEEAVEGEGAEGEGGERRRRLLIKFGVTGVVLGVV